MKMIQSLSLLVFATVLNMQSQAQETLKTGTASQLSTPKAELKAPPIPVTRVLGDPNPPKAVVVSTSSKPVVDELPKINKLDDNKVATPSSQENLQTMNGTAKKPQQPALNIPDSRPATVAQPAMVTPVPKNQKTQPLPVKPTPEKQIE